MMQQGNRMVSNLPDVRSVGVFDAQVQAHLLYLQMTSDHDRSRTAASIAWLQPARRVDLILFDAKV
jgi:hypothetical protein